MQPFNHMFPLPTLADPRLQCLNSWSTATKKGGYRNKERRSRNREKKSVERFAVTHVLGYIPFHLTNPSSSPSPQPLLLLHQKLQGKVYETRASLMRRYSEPVEPPPLWKMQRWSKVLLLYLAHPQFPPPDWGRELGCQDEGLSAVL